MCFVVYDAQTRQLIQQAFLNIRLQIDKTQDQLIAVTRQSPMCQNLCFQLEGPGYFCNGKAYIAGMGVGILTQNRLNQGIITA